MVVVVDEAAHEHFSDSETIKLEYHKRKIHNKININNENVIRIEAIKNYFSAGLWREKNKSTFSMHFLVVGIMLGPGQSGTLVL